MKVGRCLLVFVNLFLIDRQRLHNILLFLDWFDWLLIPRHHQKVKN